MLRAIVGVMAVGVLLWMGWTDGQAYGQAKAGGGGLGGGGGGGGLGGGGGGLGGGGGGGLGGGSGGLGGGSGGLGGGSGLGGSTTGSTTGRTGTTGGASGGQNTIGSTSPFGLYYGNPLAIGFPATGTSASNASQYQRAFPEQLSFGQPTYGTVNVSRTTNTTGLGSGTTASSILGATGLGNTGLGGGASGTATVTPGFPGASTAGIRRAPPYITVPVFDMPARPAAAEVRSDLQQMIDRSTRLPSRQNIRVSVDGQVVILRGKVRNERERRLAEAAVRLTPGVRTVRNLLEPESR